MLELPEAVKSKGNCVITEGRVCLYVWNVGEAKKEKIRR